MLHIMDYDKHVATVELIDSKIIVTPVGEDNAGTVELVEDMRKRFVNGRDLVLSDTELYYSLPERLNGSLWAGEPRATPLAKDDMDSA